MKILISGVFLFSFCFSNLLYAAENPWQLKKNQEGISVSTRPVDGSPILEFKADTIVDAPLKDVIAFFEDTKKLPLWYYQCTHSELVQDESPQQKVIYIVLHLPWPVTERDCIFRQTKSEDPANKTVSYSITALPDRLPAVKGKIRVLSIKSVWRFTSLSQGRTEIYLQQHSNPGGSIPAFLVNQLMVDIPFNSLKNLRKLVTGKDDS